MPEQGQFTGGVAELAPDDVQKRALARSVGTHQRVDVAFVHVDVHAIDRNEAAEVHGQPSTGEHYLPISAWRAVDVRLDHAPASRGKRYYTCCRPPFRTRHPHSAVITWPRYGKTSPRPPHGLSPDRVSCDHRPRTGRRVLPGRAWTRLRCRRWIRARVRPGGNDAPHRARRSLHTTAVHGAGLARGRHRSDRPCPEGTWRGF